MYSNVFITMKTIC